MNNCPVCGGELKPGALNCKLCGSDRDTGWKEEAEYDIPLPEFDDDDYEELLGKEFGEKNPSKSKFTLQLIAVICVLAFLAGILIIK